jgi:hypothetical protein
VAGDFQNASVLHLSKRRHQVAIVAMPRIAQRAEPVMVHPGQLVVGAIPVGAVDFLVGQLDQAVEVPLVALLQERIGEHRAQRG